MKLFEKQFIKHLTENNAAGAGGVFGDAGSMGFGGAIHSSDFYAPGDMRTPLGGKKGPKKTRKKQKKSLKPRDGSIQPLIPIQSRPLNSQM